VKKLYRSNTDRKIAGVCAGLGEHFDMDPLIFRLFFLFSVFVGGLGALAYLIMWAAVPVQPGTAAAAATPGRLHLSGSDRKIAGVCGGLGEYFRLDPVFFRVAFLLLVFAGGTGVFLYLALWLLVPRGQTPASTTVATA
jgi:phage shock protein PspC (stress-responsive transcriptional regulator)